ncbi:MAG: hypothetical protein K2H09_10525 [Treponemataceae bacterium]|nr:hypothetical protein [Treponemataceae bacterium]
MKDFEHTKPFTDESKDVPFPAFSVGMDFIQTPVYQKSVQAVQGTYKAQGKGRIGARRKRQFR